MDIHGPLQTRGEIRCPGEVSVSCLASRTRHECQQNTNKPQSNGRTRRREQSPFLLLVASKQKKKTKLYLLYRKSTLDTRRVYIPCLVAAQAECLQDLRMLPKCCRRRLCNRSIQRDLKYRRRRHYIRCIEWYVLVQHYDI